MVPPFYIYKVVTTEGRLKWIEGVQDLQTGKARIQTLAAEAPGEYVIVSQTTGNRFVIKAERSRPKSA